VEDADAVVNLAGENILGGRWTRRRRARIERSRVDLTEQIVASIGAARNRPSVFVSANAIGYYGDRGDEVLAEDSSPGTDWVARMCQRWETAAMRATAHGVRVVPVRIGVVISPHDGALARMLPIFRAGVGGRLGSGEQYMSWIHIEDLIGVLENAIADARYVGPINAVAPNPVTNRTFTAELACVLGRSARLPVPRLALRAAVGKGASVLLASQRVDPRRLGALGYTFLRPTIREALVDVSDGSPSVLRAGPVPLAEYLQARKPTHQLRQSTRINAPIDEVFAFFSDAANLGVITPPDLAFRIVTPQPIDMGDGTVIDYRIGIGPFPMRWRTVIESWRPPQGFIDSQHKGPYRSWWHSHSFRSDGDSTVMEDRVYYAAPLGPLGRIANRLFIARMLRRIFSYRSQAIHLRFPPKARARFKEVA
jgi:uncharacterized protein (TIGR01777 family)